ncbi:MAG: hypothetical protein HC820_04330 [Hydrococcus sp. RM1_1_31]|nr:hypothetical protein [Hydrococcus sp. RM1_1_31]
MAGFDFGSFFEYFVGSSVRKLEDYLTRSLVEALWILQMFGCDFAYQWKPGTSNSLKCKAIGNGVAYLNASEVLESLISI